jgi:hypothetical protein
LPLGVISGPEDSEIAVSGSTHRQTGAGAVEAASTWAVNGSSSLLIRGFAGRLFAALLGLLVLFVVFLTVVAFTHVFFSFVEM